MEEGSKKFDSVGASTMLHKARPLIPNRSLMLQLTADHKLSFELPDKRIIKVVPVKPLTDGMIGVSLEGERGEIDVFGQGKSFFNNVLFEVGEESDGLLPVKVMLLNSPLAIVRAETAMASRQEIPSKENLDIDFIFEEPLQKDKPILTALCNMILAF